MWSRNKQRCIKYGIDAPPNGLRVSRRLEGIALIDREGLFAASRR